MAHQGTGFGVALDGFELVCPKLGLITFIGCRRVGERRGVEPNLLEWRKRGEAPFHSRGSFRSQHLTVVSDIP